MEEKQFNLSPNVRMNVNDTSSANVNLQKLDAEYQPSAPPTQPNLTDRRPGNLDLLATNLSEAEKLNLNTRSWYRIGGIAKELLQALVKDKNDTPV